MEKLKELYAKYKMPILIGASVLLTFFVVKRMKK